jgi:hypothetical protein
MGQMTPDERKYELPLQAKHQRAALLAVIALFVLLISSAAFAYIRRRRGREPE